MRTSKFSSIAIAMLMTFLCLFSITSINVYAVNLNKIIYLICDPRDIVQFASGFTIIQNSQELLYVTVIRESDQAIVYETNSFVREITIITESWETGEYKVKTTCTHDNFQDFHIEI